MADGRKDVDSMGFYLNSSGPYSLYKSETAKPYFVDKSRMLEELFPLVEEGKSFICITRPRRFGKTVMANMIGSFFMKGIHSDSLFRTLEISASPDYGKYLNQKNVIYIDFSRCDDECLDYKSYISNIKELLREDLRSAYPECGFRENGTVSEDLTRIHQMNQEKFIFVLDEWDAIFHMPFVTEKDKQQYLLFLKGLLKDQPYVSLAYMTGILPIAKYSSGSELNMFWEYSMIAQERFSKYFGFTETEVGRLFERYMENTENPCVTREGLRSWYNGYHTASGERVYNPRSVVTALENNQLGNYWTSSGPYDEIFYYIKKNVDDVREDLVLMCAGEAVETRVQEYAAVSMNLQTKSEIFSAMVVYGFLSYENGKVSIPNKELMDKFSDMMQKESTLGYVYRLAKESDRMLKATLAGDTKTMAEILEYAHDTETPLLSYSHETELAAVVNLVYLSARDRYEVQREDKSGIGFVDFIFYPRADKREDCIILELKVDHTPEEAVHQIKEKKYALRFQGKLGEKPEYTGRILAVGIGYERDTKEHSCMVEVLRDKCKARQDNKMNNV